MTRWLGYYLTTGTRTHVRFQFSTHAAAGGNVAPSSAFENSDLRIYRANDGAAYSATQRSSASGITMTSPFDSLTGVHDVDIDLADNTDSGFYASGYRYSIVLAPDETVDSQTITGIVLGEFEIGTQPANAIQVSGTTQTARDLGASVLLSSGTGTGQLDFTSGVVKANVTQFGGTNGSFSGGRPAVNTTYISGDNLCPGIISSLLSGMYATVDSATSTTVTLSAANNTTNDFYNGQKVYILSGSVAGHERVITDYDGGTLTLTVSPAWTTAPSNGNEVLIMPAEAAVATIESGAINAAAIADGAIDRATFAADTGLQTTRSNTAQAGGATTITLDASASAVDDFYNSCLIFLTGGTGVGQARFISDYVGATKVATVATWATNPDNTSMFAVIPFGSIPGASDIWAHGTRTLTSATNITSDGNSISQTQLARLDADVSSRLAPTTAGRTLDVSAGGEAGVDWANIGTPGSTVNLSATTVKTITDGVTLATSENVYTANINLNLDATNDEYSVSWYKNGILQTSGITSPAIQVIKRSDGTDLIASVSMSQIGSTGSYKYTETVSRITDGETFLVKCTATIDGSTRTFGKYVSRDA